MDAAAGIQDEFEGVIGRIREHWPMTRIIVRTDSGFCRDDIMAWCEDEENVDSVIGLAKNSRLKALSVGATAEAVTSASKTGMMVRRFCEFTYRTLDTWSRARRVIARAEALPEDETACHCKENNRTIVPFLDAQGYPGQALYEDFYCARGDAENRVKELKCDLFAERSSSGLFDANTVRLFVSTFAHVLYNRLREALAATPLARASPTTLALRLLKIGARVRISARRIHIAMSSGCPDKVSFAAAWKALAPI